MPTRFLGETGWYFCFIFLLRLHWLFIRFYVVYNIHPFKLLPEFLITSSLLRHFSLLILLQWLRLNLFHNQKPHSCHILTRIHTGTATHTRANVCILVKLHTKHTYRCLHTQTHTNTHTLTLTHFLLLYNFQFINLSSHHQFINLLSLHYRPIRIVCINKLLTFGEFSIYIHNLVYYYYYCSSDEFVKYFNYV